MPLADQPGGVAGVLEEPSDGDLVGVQKPDGTVDVEFLEEITYEDSRSVRGRFTLQIGRPDAEREPGAIALGKIRRFGNWLTRAALSE